MEDTERRELLGRGFHNGGTLRLRLWLRVFKWDEYSTLNSGQGFYDVKGVW